MMTTPLGSRLSCGGRARLPGEGASVRPHSNEQAFKVQLGSFAKQVMEMPRHEAIVRPSSQPHLHLERANPCYLIHRPVRCGSISDRVLPAEFATNASTRAQAFYVFPSPIASWNTSNCGLRSELRPPGARHPHHAAQCPRPIARMYQWHLRARAGGT
ncbi:hypothetical protein GY45DRAFT_55897 [Cubamyces sp. BRFM 1775]|nr:hypothetical protein GY45DRAFT_55897 [Cubamyces sp. BRFM 1775]